MRLTSIAVFCGSRSGNQSCYEEDASMVGRLAAINKMKIVYGGGNKGLMAAVANAALAAGGEVVGVIPDLLCNWEHQHEGLTALHVVTDMHSRKKMMYDMCDAAIVLPGGFGTMDELFEMITWNSLSIHNKKIILLNSGGYYDPLLLFIDRMFEQGFLWADWKDRIAVFKNAEAIFSSLG